MTEIHTIFFSLCFAGTNKVQSIRLYLWVTKEIPVTQDFISTLYNIMHGQLWCVRESGKGLSLLQKAVHPYAQVLYLIELFIDGFCETIEASTIWLFNWQFCVVALNMLILKSSY